MAQHSIRLRVGWLGRSLCGVAEASVASIGEPGVFRRQQPDWSLWFERIQTNYISHSGEDRKHYMFSVGQFGARPSENAAYTALGANQCLSLQPFCSK